MDQIILPNDIDQDLTNILTILCINIQTRDFDISPIILNKIFNNQDFIEAYLFIYQQCYAEMIMNINRFKIAYKNHIDRYYQQIELSDEKCGFLKILHQNSYFTYCNKHKYLHIDPDSLSSNHQEKDCQYIVDHHFVRKSKDQIIKEKYRDSIHLFYQKFINKTYHLIYRVFIDLLLRQSETEYIKINKTNAKSLIEQMKNDPSFFKSKDSYQLPIMKSKDSNDYYICLYKFHQ